MSAPSVTKNETTAYEIKDAEGRLVAVHHRIDTEGGKKMWWELPDGTKRLNGTPLAALPLYGSEHVSDYDPDDLIVITEGEKAAQALLDAGIPALGTVTGAGGTPSPEALEVVRDLEVTLWADADDSGREHMQRVAQGLQGVASAVRWYEWLEAPEKGDAADHPATQSGHEKDVGRLLNDLMGARAWEPTPEVRSVEGSIPATFTAAELLSEELPEVQWAVPTLIPEGVTLFAGKPKLGKSWAMLGMCVAVATGGMAFGKVGVECGDALYLALEDNRRRLKRRLSKLLAGGSPPGRLRMATTWPRLDEGGVEALDAWLRAHPNARLVVIDTLARFKPHGFGRRSAYDADREAVDPLAPLAAEHNVDIVLVHHLREMESDDPLDMIHGSAGLTGGVDGG